MSPFKDPTLKVMTQQELNFSYKIESMMGDIGRSEYRQLLVEVNLILILKVNLNKTLATMHCCYNHGKKSGNSFYRSA